MEQHCIAVVITQEETGETLWNWFYSSAQVGAYIAQLPFFWSIQHVEIFKDRQPESKITHL